MTVAPTPSMASTMPFTLWLDKLSIITTYLIPWIKKNASAKTQESIKLWTCIAVQAAEQIYGSKQGAQKKKFVLDYLSGKGIKADDAQLEAAVYELINGFTLGTAIEIE